MLCLRANARASSVETCLCRSHLFATSTVLTAGQPCVATSASQTGMLAKVSRLVSGLLPGDVEAHQAPNRTAVVGPGNAAEGLLAGSVPDLRLDRLSVNDN